MKKLKKTDIKEGINLYRYAPVISGNSPFTLESCSVLSCEKRDDRHIYICLLSRKGKSAKKQHRWFNFEDIKHFYQLDIESAKQFAIEEVQRKFDAETKKYQQKIKFLNK